MFLYLFVLCIIIMGGLATCATFSLFHFLATAFADGGFHKSFSTLSFLISSFNTYLHTHTYKVPEIIKTNLSAGTE